MEWDGAMGPRFPLIGMLSIGLISGSEVAQAQDASGATEVLPAIEVSPPPTSAKPGQTRNPRRVAQNLRRGFVYPTAPTSTAGSGMDVDKVPAGINALGAAQIQRTGSLNIADALQQQVPGVVVNEVSGNPFQPNVQFRGFVASPVAGAPQGLAVYPKVM